MSVPVKAVNKKEKNIYLASASRPRKELLGALGLKVSVLRADSQESGYNGAKVRSFSALVKNNALAKARSAGQKVQTGIIIAADTVSVKDGKIYGKPSDLREALLMLRKLSGGRQEVYTGVAVIEKKGGRICATRSACEKTAVFMDKLSDGDIKNYFSTVSPLDKAGSFDIQGKGALFIRGVGGCFYNVVGLPLRRLRLMLKHFGVDILACS